MEHPAATPSLDDRREAVVVGGLAIVTLTTYFFCVALGQSWGIAIFLLVWVGALALKPQLMLEHLRDWLMWLMPLLCLASVAWSRNPSVTFRSTIEFIVFTAAVLTLGRLVSARVMLVALTIALAAVAVASFATGKGNMLYGTDTYALTGLFASKNALVFTCGMLAIAGFGGALYRGLPIPVRLICLAGAIGGLGVGFLGRSLGGSVATILACGALIAMVVAGKLPRPGRVMVLILVIGGVTAILATFFLVPKDTISGLLVSVGKSPDLTGRAYLWGRAVDAIAERPILGVGFTAYWSPIFADALGLYRYGGIASETGFHFHNLFYETAVELGYVGVATMAITLLGILAMAFYRFIVRPDSATAFVLGIMVLLLSRIGLEVDFLSPFSSGVMLLCLSYQILLDRPPVSLRSQRHVVGFRSDAYA